MTLSTISERTGLVPNHAATQSEKPGRLAEVLGCFPSIDPFYQEFDKDGDAKPWIKTNRADLFFAIAIMLNAVVLGIEAESALQNGGEADAALFWIQLLFYLLFVVELFLRLKVDGMSFFSLRNKSGLFDVFIVSTSTLEYLVLLILGDASGLKVLSAMRMARLLRIVRISKVIRLVPDLWLLITSLICSLKAVFWMGVLLMVLMYIGCLICAMELGKPDCTDCTELSSTATNSFTCCSEDSLVLLNSFGSLDRSFFTHFMVLTLEGYPDVARAAGKVSFIWYIYIVFFILVSSLVFINLVTGIIVENVLVNAKSLDEGHGKTRLEEELEFKELFMLACVDKGYKPDAEVHLEEFTQLVRCPIMREILDSIGVCLRIDSTELFLILDPGSHGKFTVAELGQQLLRLRDSKEHLQSLIVQGDLVYGHKKVLQHVGQTRHNVSSYSSELCTALDQQLQVQLQHLPEAARCLASALSSEEDYSPDIDGGEWKLVRHVPAGKTWHPADDQLVGTAIYGKQSEGHRSSSPWSIKFDEMPFDEFLFATGDESKWLISTRDSVTGGFYANEHRSIRKSSTVAEPSQAKWCRRDGHKGDPWILLGDHEQKGEEVSFLYCESSQGAQTKTLLEHFGANVFIRNSRWSTAAPAKQEACSPRESNDLIHLLSAMEVRTGAAGQVLAKLQAELETSRSRVRRLEAKVFREDASIQTDGLSFSVADQWNHDRGEVVHAIAILPERRYQAPAFDDLVALRGLSLGVDLLMEEREREDSARLAFTIEVTILGARRLPKPEFLRKSRPYCICQLRGKAPAEFRTSVMSDTLNPVWQKEAFEFDAFTPGDTLDFIVMDEETGKTADDILATASLSSEQFWPHGFRGELELAEIGGVGSAVMSTLSVIVCVHGAALAQAIPVQFSKLANVIQERQGIEDVQDWEQHLDESPRPPEPPLQLDHEFLMAFRKRPNPSSRTGKRAALDATRTPDSSDQEESSRSFARRHPQDQSLSQSLLQALPRKSAHRGRTTSPASTAQRYFTSPGSTVRSP